MVKFKKKKSISNVKNVATIIYIRGGDRRAGRGLSSYKKIVFPALSLIIFIFLS